MKKQKLKRVYFDGGALIGPIAGGATSILDGFEKAKPKAGLSAAKGAMSGAAAGAAMGPWGALAGGVLGGVSGLISGKQQEKAYETDEELAARAKNTMFMNNSAAVLRADPSKAYGNKISGYYALGGDLGKNFLASTPVINGNLKPLSSKHTEVQGPAHEQGGVDLPNYGAEVEGQETTSGPRIFSHAMGFAKLHKPIARAVGKIEAKPATEERINALKRLQQREDDLYQLQEQIKLHGYGQ
jgi:hypothetical protein